MNYKKGKYALSVLRNQIKSRIQFYHLSVISAFYKTKLSGLQSFCWFMGYPRTGHTLIAAIVDAHPQCCIADEWDILFHLNQGYNRFMLYAGLANSSARFRKHGNKRSGHNYSVENMWQGRYSNLQIIGDKSPGRTFKILEKNPDMLVQLSKTIDLPVKCLHILRNPFDAIASMIIRHARKFNIEDYEKIPYQDLTERFFSKVETNNRIIDSGRFDIHAIYHEDFLEQPAFHLDKLLHFFNLESTPEYIAACCKIVHKTPDKTRYQVPWNKNEIDLISENIRKYDFLKRYTFES